MPEAGGAEPPAFWLAAKSLAEPRPKANGKSAVGRDLGVGGRAR